MAQREWRKLIGPVLQTTEKDDEDAKIGQRDLDKASGADAVIKDRQSLKFLAIIGAEPDQILR